MEMDDLRWILLAAAVVVIAVIVFFTRSRKKEQQTAMQDTMSEDVPSFSATNEKEVSRWMDGVGPVRVVDKPGEISIEQDEFDAMNLPTENHQAIEKVEIPEDEIDASIAPDEKNISSGDEEAVSGKMAEESESDGVAIDDVISVYVLAKPDEAIKGEKILSASYALHLDYGDMKIFHRHSQASGREIEFSMASIQEPGWFEIDNMNDMQTSGLSFFMQVNLVEQPSAVLDEMLICAHSLSTMLGATLCNAQRKPLDEATTIELREKVQRLEILKAKSV